MIVKTKTCSKCGETKPLDEFHNQKANKDGKRSYCKECKSKEDRKYREEHREELSERQKKYREKNREKNREYMKKYYIEFGRQKQGKKPMNENKSCSSYLGIVIGERLCRHLFKDVEVMPNNNPGCDIICNEGKKIDVKTSSLWTKDGKHPHWSFEIKRNKTADFFVCVAFDNRTDLNLLHMWMIPGKEVNHRRGISIRPSTIHKWDKWKRDINDAQLCCTKLKSHK